MTVKIVLAVIAVFVVAAGLIVMTLQPTAERSAARDSKAAGERVLRVCADPNNLPFSNDRLEGFENQIAELLANEMNAKLEYYWWAQHRGFIRNTLGSGRCDVLIGTATAMDRVLTTAPYYRSAWMFVTRADRDLNVTSFDAPALKRLRIGVHLVGDDGANTPPVHALERRHMAANMVGFHLMGDYTRPNPPTELLEAVVNREVDIAVAWGPLAGYFAKDHAGSLRLTPVSPAVDVPFLPMVYDISVGVRRADDPLRREIDGILERRRADVDRVLDSFGVPRLDDGGELLNGARL